ncbi:MAG TPA: ferredoxin [Pseudonocardiaceae bacterium]|jgi:ferredoxin|nr:ferredoxin [Pseudonocardiaceae bacterium]
MKINADTAVCVASGQCALLVPAVFDQRDDDGIVVVRNEEPPPEQHDAVRQAVLICPSGALRLVE